MVCGVASLGYDHMELLGMFSALMYLEFIRTPKVPEELQHWKGMFWLSLCIFPEPLAQTVCMVRYVRISVCSWENEDCGNS